MIKRAGLFGIAIAALFSQQAQGAPGSTVEPDAVKALNNMGAYLRTLNSFEIKADTATDTVLDNDQTVQFAGQVSYKVRRPNKFVISVADDRKVRQFDYDGKSFTVFAPRIGYYATVPAPPTIHELLAAAEEKYGIELPLADLFRWGLANDNHEDLTSGVVVGYAKINGADADQYAFREGDIDWQIWIQRGDRPLPVKVVITDRRDSAHPVFSSAMRWTVNPVFDDAVFAFKPPKDAKPIVMAKQ